MLLVSSLLRRDILHKVDRAIIVLVVCRTPTALALAGHDTSTARGVMLDRGHRQTHSVRFLLEAENLSGV